MNSTVYALIVVTAIAVLIATLILPVMQITGTGTEPGLREGEIDVQGNVFVNGELIDEPYIAQKAFGECDIEFPYQVAR